MRVRIMRDGMVVNVINVKRDKRDSEFNILHRVEHIQQTEDVLKTGMLGKVDIGITSIQCKDGIWSASEDNKGTYKIDGEERNLKFDVRMYETGFVLNTGKKGTNIFGTLYEAYFRSIGRSNIHCCPKSDAKVFTSLANVKSFITKHEESLRYLVKKHGYSWGIEYANALFEEDYNASLEKMTDKKREKEEKLFSEIKEMLDTISTIQPEDDKMPKVQVPDEITPETMKAEALRRMDLLSMWDRVVKDFHDKNEVFMSEAGGIIYDLDDEAKKAVEEVKGNNLLPYAVIHQSTTIGELYTVLYVSGNGDVWQFEVPDRKGCMEAFVRNATDPILSDYGDVQVQSANGGLVRVA